jgi:hypothetical protein
MSIPPDQWRLALLGKLLENVSNHTLANCNITLALQPVNA